MQTLILIEVTVKLYLNHVSLLTTPAEAHETKDKFINNLLKHGVAIVPGSSSQTKKQLES